MRPHHISRREEENYVHGRAVMKDTSARPDRRSGNAVAPGDALGAQPASESFIVRIYRIDTEDDGKIGGLVEVLDGSEESEPFTCIDELGAILKRRVTRP